jgi:hypothetical protein
MYGLLWVINGHKREIPRAVAAYLWYFVKHRWFVLLGGLRVLWIAMRFSPATDLQRRPSVLEAVRLVCRLLVHDLSKLWPSEFMAYMLYFKTTIRSEEGLRLIGEFTLAELAPRGAAIGDYFSVAWLKHQRRNRHHWEWWVLYDRDYPEGLCIPMPMVDLLEMLADWAGAGRAISGRWEAAEWYLANRGRIRLETDTRVYVERVLSKMTEGKK